MPVYGRVGVARGHGGWNSRCGARERCVLLVLSVTNQRPIPSPEVADFLVRFGDPLAAFCAGHFPGGRSRRCVVCAQPWPCDLMHWIDTAHDDHRQPDVPGGAA